jgi:YesN/AraC family two-component response regulator
MGQVQEHPRVHPRRPTRVLIADDRAQIRRGLTGLVALDDIVVIAEAVNGVEPVALAAQMTAE